MIAWMIFNGERPVDYYDNRNKSCTIYFDRVEAEHAMDCVDDIFQVDPENLRLQEIYIPFDPSKVKPQ